MKYDDGHFYSTVPDSRSLVYPTKKSNLGINIDDKKMREFLEYEMLPYYQSAPFTDDKGTYRYGYRNPSFGYNDGLALYGMIRYYQPRKIIEVGSGHSSGMMYDTREIENLEIDILHIEPYPETLNAVVFSEDNINLIEDKLQNVPVDKFESLGNNDLLFIDSSHVVKIGSDVQYLFFEILPRLKAGVIVHFHDIFSGFEYPKEWIDKQWYWNEAYILKAFLMHNRDYEILLFNNYMGTEFKDLYEREFPLCLKNIGASIYLKKVS